MPSRQPCTCKRAAARRAPAPTGCQPGTYEDDSGECKPCGFGYFCPDGVARVECDDAETTEVANATMSDECYVADCEPCGADAAGGAGPAYFTTKK